MVVNPQPTRPAISRALLGICAGLMIVIGLAGWLVESWPFFFNSMLRAGILLFGVWLALPQLTGGRWKLTAGLLLIGVILIAILASRPRLLPLVVVILAALYILQSAVSRFTRGQS